MQCAQCGTQADTGQRFCGQCGRALSSACPQCGHENPGDHRFCGGCGTSLGTGVPVATSPAPAVPAIERRVVSVLFVDLVGFTSFSEGRDPEDVRGMITDYFDLARNVVERFGGTVDKYIGDAVMAWWGATTTNEDDAERAVRASLELVESVTTMGERLGIPGLNARVGVMTGEVSVGPGGNERGLLLGDLVNTASRLQSLAEAGTVLVGEETASLVDTAIEVIEAGTHQLKGREEPVKAYQAVRVLAERGGRGRSDFVEPPFVGRAAELRLLKDSLEAVTRESRARLVSLVGQAGIGKSRLVWEFQKYTDGLVADVYWHEGRSPSYGDGLSLWALGEMIRRRAGIQEIDPDSVTGERLEEAISEFVPDPEDQAWVGDRLAALLGLGGSIGSERTELFAAARMFFEGMAAKGAVVMVFEDLHWADPSLLEFVDELPDWSQNHPILVVTLSRPDLLDRRPDWGSGRRGFASTYVGPLSNEEMRELIAGSVPGVPSPVVDRIVATAGGVPLFAVEMVRMLLADGRLVVGDSGVEVIGDLDQLEVPSSVHAVVGARLDRLAPDDREVARDAAVLGQSFTVESLAGLRDEEVDKVERRLSDLVRREIFELVRDPRSPERGQYRWVQSVVREVAYGRISRSDRHDLHLRVARYLRDLNDPEVAPLVASHYVVASETASVGAGGIEGELGEALRAAISRAEVLHAHEQLIALVDSALPVVGGAMEFELRELAVLSAVRLSDSETAQRHLAAINSLADSAGDESSKHRAVALAGRVANDFRQPHEADKVLSPHLARYQDFGADPDLARAAVYLARTRMLLGDDKAAAELADRALAAVEKFGLLEDVADALVTRGTALVGSRPNQGMVLLRGALDLASRLGFSDVKLRCLINIGYGAPDPAEALRASQEAFDEAKRIGDRSHASFVAGNLIGSYSFRLDNDAAEAILDDPVLSNNPADRVNLLTGRHEMLARRGEWARAEEALDEAQTLNEGLSDPQTKNAIERAQATKFLLEGRGRDVYEIGHRHFHEHPFAPLLSAYIALEGAVLEGDAQLLAEADEMIASLAPGTDTPGFGLWAGAMRRIVDGELSGALEEIEKLVDRHVGAARWFALEMLAMTARHLPVDHPSRGVFADRARALADESGSPGLLEWIDMLVGDGPLTSIRTQG
jgi:class 3 adenylate cyclase/tetratricopeptide (TPR) repeat protein